MMIHDQLMYLQIFGSNLRFEIWMPKKTIIKLVACQASLKSQKPYQPFPTYPKVGSYQIYQLPIGNTSGIPKFLTILGPSHPALEDCHRWEKLSAAFLNESGTSRGQSVKLEMAWRFLDFDGGPNIRCLMLT